MLATRKHTKTVILFKQDLLIYLGVFIKPLVALLNRLTIFIYFNRVANPSEFFLFFESCLYFYISYLSSGSRVEYWNLSSLSVLPKY